MKRIALRLMIFSLLLLGLVALPVTHAVADDETNQVEIKVQAVLGVGAVNCTAMTISLLGLPIDISQAGINRNTNSSNSEGEINTDLNAENLTCADLALAVGQVVEVKLFSDIPDPITLFLSASEVDIGGGECEDSDCDAVKVAGPLQGIDPSGTSVMVLGLLIDITQASLEGADDGDTEGNNQLVDVSELITGQFLELTLFSTQPPLAASTLEVKNFTNEVVVEIIDENGNQVDDGDVDDVQIDVEVTMMVQAPLVRPGMGMALARGIGTAQARKRVKKVLTFQMLSNGSVTLNGLPTGQAKIFVTRVHNGQTSTARSSFKVLANGTTYRRIRLRPVR